MASLYCQNEAEHRNKCRSDLADVTIVLKHLMHRSNSFILTDHKNSACIKQVLDFLANDTIALYIKVIHDGLYISRIEEKKLSDKTKHESANIVLSKLKNNGFKSLALQCLELNNDKSLLQDAWEKYSYTRDIAAHEKFAFAVVFQLIRCGYWTFDDLHCNK